MTDPYRKDIDGLRALAVLPVLFFHAGLPGFSGGYVGVDVFFVISGYLITQIIMRELDEGSFSILRFYERRVRRIFPALFAMLAVVMAAGIVILLPGDLKSLARSAIWTLLSASNFLFYSETDYFDVAGIFKPLLHTWSLAVEEQFYLLLPATLMIVARWRPQMIKPILWAMAIVSFVVAVAVKRGEPAFAFYLLPARDWELLAGSLLALGAFPTLRATLWREAAALAGLVLIALPVFFYDEETPFPGFGALPPVLGAVLILQYASGTRLGHLLSINWLRGVGLISYSLYLWHWPIIVFATYLRQAPVAGWSAFLVIALSFAAAFLSWRFVEQPFRRPKPGHQLKLWRGVFGSVAVLGAIAIAVLVSGGLPGRFSADIAEFDKSNHRSPLKGRCDENGDAKTQPQDVCRLGDETVAPTIAIWADSHGFDLTYALAELGQREHFSVLPLTRGGCPPSLDTTMPVRPRCPRRNRQVLSYLQAHSSIDTVVLAAYFELDRYSRDADFDSGFLAAVDALLAAGKRVIVVGPIPQQPFDVPRLLATAKVWHQPEPTGVPSSVFLARSEPMRDLVAKAQERGASVVFPHEILCDANTCGMMRDGTMLYMDSNHPSIEAARMIAAKILPLLHRSKQDTGGEIGSSLSIDPQG